MVGRRIIFLCLSGFCLLAGLASPVSAQYMPWSRLAEDTVYYAREYFPEGLAMSSSGPGQVWDFRYLKAPFAVSYRVNPMGQRDDKAYGYLQSGTQTIAVLDLRDPQALQTQSVETNPFCPSMLLTYDLQPARRMFYVGVLGESDAFKGRKSVTFAWPRDLACAWLPTPLPDSCRITVSMQEDILVDASGTLHLPTTSMTVLRQLMVTRSAMRVENLVQGRWKDVTPTVPGLRLLRENLRMRFVDAQSGMLMAEAELGDKNQIISMMFMTHPLVTRILPEEPSKPDILAYPNPSYGPMRFQLRDFANGHYQLRIFNILGVPVRDVEVWVDHPRETVSVDLSELQRGTYIYRLQDSSGKALRTKKIVLIST